MVILLVVAAGDQLVRAHGWGHGSWQLGECLINYQGGFVRRGLLGEAYWQLSRGSGIPANLLAIWGGVIAYAGLVWWMWARSRGTIPRLFLLSAICLGFPAYQDCIVRKDCLGLLCLVGCLEIRRSWGDASLRTWVGINLLGVLSMLIHESFLFYALGLVVLVESPRGWNGIAGAAKRICCLIPSWAAFGIAAMFHGSAEVSERVNASLVPLWRQLDPSAVGVETPAGAIAGLGWTPEQALGPSWNLLTSGIYQPGIWVVLYGISFLLTLGLVGGFPATATDRSQARVRLIGLLVVQWLSVSPLFILGFDYGRWLYFWLSGSLIAYALGFQLPRWLRGWLESPLHRWRIPDRLDALPWTNWYLLLWGVPVCWNLREGINAIPVMKLWAVFFGT